MGKVSESIFSGETKIIPMADVQHIERMESGIWIITKHTKYNFDKDIWENPIFLHGEEAESFKQAWCYYRYELEQEYITTA